MPLLKQKPSAPSGAIAKLAVAERRRRIEQRVQREGLTGAAAKAEVKRRMEDVGGLSEVRKPAQSVTKSRVEQRPPASAARSERWVARDLYLHDRLTPFRRGCLPATADPKAGIERALTTRGEGTRTYRLNPAAGKSSALIIMSDPLSPHFGWACVIADVAASGGLVVPGYGAAFLSNPDALGCFNTAGDTYIDMPFTRNPFTGTNDEAIDNVLDYSTDPAPTEYPWEAQGPTRVSGMTPIKGCMDIESTVSYTGLLEVYNVSTNTHPTLLGPQTGVINSNDGDSSNSAVLCRNPLLVDESWFKIQNGAALTDVHYMDGIYTAVSPTIQMGGSPSAKMNYHVNCATPNHGRWLATNGTDSVSTALVEHGAAGAGNGMYNVYSNDFTLKNALPFVFRGEEQQHALATGEAVSVADAAQEAYAAAFDRTMVTVPQILQSVDSVQVFICSAGSASIRVNYAREYGMFVDRTDIVASLGEQPVGAEMHFPNDVLGQVGSGPSLQHAREQAIRATAQLAANKGAPLPQHVVRKGVEQAKNAGPLSMVSGILNKVVGLGGKVLNGLQAVPQDVVSKAVGSVFGESAGNFAAKAFSFIPDILEMF